jgi:hypothetical protein
MTANVSESTAKLLGAAASPPQPRDFYSASSSSSSFRVLDEAGYGSVSRMLAVVSIVNNVVVATSLQASHAWWRQQRKRRRIAFRQRCASTRLALFVSTTFALLAGTIAD